MSYNTIQTIVITGALSIVAVTILVSGWLYLRSRRKYMPEDWSSEKLNQITGQHPVIDPSAISPLQADLVPAVLFDHVAGEHPIQLDWQPPTFTQTWNIKPHKTEKSVSN